MSRQGNTVKDSFQYFRSQIIYKVMAIARGVILPNLLSPLHYGIVSSLNLVERYSEYTNLGIHTATLYKVPAKRAVGDLKEAESIKNHVYSFSLLTGGLAVLLILFGTFFNAEKISKEIFWGLLIVSVTPFLIMYRGVYISLLRANKEFGLVSTETVVRAVVGVGLVIGLALGFRAYGVLLGDVLATVFVILFIQRRTLFRFKFELAVKKIVALLRFSIPIFFMVGLLSTFLLTLDRLMIIKYFGVQEVGYYTIGLTLSSLVLLLPTSISVVLSTKLIEDCSRPDGNAEGFLSETTSLIALSVSFLVTLLYLAFPAIFEIIFPKYKQGLQSAMILPFAFYFEAIGRLPYYALIGMEKIKSYIIILGVIAGTSYLLFDVVLKGKGLLAVAFLMVFVLFLKNMSALLLSSLSTMQHKKEIMKFLLLPLLFIAISAIAGVFLNLILPSPPDAGGGVLLQLFFLKAVLLSFLYLPILFYFNKRTGLIRKTYEKCIVAIKMGAFLKKDLPPTTIQK